jgi:hypothetical protein
VKTGFSRFAISFPNFKLLVPLRCGQPKPEGLAGIAAGEAAVAAAAAAGAGGKRKRGGCDFFLWAEEPTAEAAAATAAQFTPV